MFLPATIITTIIDQLAKQLAWRGFGAGDSITVIPGFFDLRLVLNKGAAWGMFSGQRVFLVAVSSAMIVFLVRNRAELSNGWRHSGLMLGILCGGIIGNLIDRAKLGFVIDFLDFHWEGVYYFPVFNVADMAICVGIASHLVAQILLSRREKSQQP